MNRRIAAVAALAVLAAHAARSRADVDVEIRSGYSVRGTFDPAAEAERFRFTVPARASLTILAKPMKRGPALSLDVRNEKGSLVVGTDAGGATAVRKFTRGSTTAFEAVLRSRDGTSTGDYSFVAKWAVPRTVASVVPFGEVPEGEFAFGGPAGAKVRVVVSAAKGSAARPRLLRLVGPSGEVAGFADGVGGTSDASALVVLPEIGDYVAEIANDGEPGDVTCRATIASPKAKGRKIDLTARTIGGAGSAGAYARVLGSDGGTVAVPEGIEGLDGIAGSSVAVPGGALPGGGVIVVGTAPDLRLPDPALGPIGPAVHFGPDGTKFGSAQAVLTIPLNLDAVGGDTSKVQIWTRDAKGRETLVPPPYDFDSSPGFVSFPSSHFSSYVAATADPATGGNVLVTLASGFASVSDMAYDLTGDPSPRILFFSDGTSVVRDVTPVATGGFVTSVFAGGGTIATDGTSKDTFDFGSPVTSLYASDSSIYVGVQASKIYRIDVSSGLVYRFLGDGVAESSGDDGPATSARIREATDIVEDSDGNVWIVDRASAVVRVVDAAGVITTVAGTGVSGSNGDPGSPLATQLDEPRGIAEIYGTAWMAVAENGRVRILDVTTDTMFTRAGDPDGATGCDAGGSTGTAARFSGLTGIGHDIVNGRFYVSSPTCHAIWGVRISDGLVSVVLGTPGTQGYSQDGFLAGSGRVTMPGPLLVLPDTIVLTDGGGPQNFSVRELALGE